VKVPIGGKGGMILLSTDVNVAVGNRIADWLAARLRTAWQRRSKNSIVDRAILKELAKAGVGLGWSIGVSRQGRYYDAEARILYVEQSFYVEILDAPFPLLKAIAAELRRTFRQQEVILKSYDTGEAEHVREEPVRSNQAMTCGRDGAVGSRIATACG
jgi:hypothetical protein